MTADAPSPPPPRRSRPVRVAEAIKDWVVEQGLQPGDRLPGEAELMARFGMSKGTVREAMRLLQAQGLVATKTGPGGGSFVGEVSRERANALLANYFYFRDVTIADIYALRILLEPELAAGLAGQLTEAQLGDLERIMEGYATPAADAEEERRQHVASLAFHARLADFGENELLGYFIGFMARILTDLTVYKRLYATPNHDLWQRGRDHQIALIAALRAGEAGTAREVMKSHMEMARALMEDQEAEVMKRFIAE
ncbi:MAG: FadR family transcriptional regulator [Rhodobacteraceae bacterium]|nr:MAG: FadR family transcriptional regulator [Paracoccaceae bacterium]